MQDGSETVCLGVDTLNTETLEVIAPYTYSLEKFEGNVWLKDIYIIFIILFPAFNP